nr:EAL domain-containing protein [Flavimaribacter sediminis]
MAYQIVCNGHGLGFFLEYVGLGAAVASIGVWWLTRQALLQVIATRSTARQQQEKAERLEKEARLQADADTMTGLPNRARLFHELDKRMNGLKQGGQAFLLAILALDGLDLKDDGIGHRSGAGLFKQVASNLQLAAGGQNFCARMGQGAFAVISDDPETVADPESFALRLRTALSGEYHLDPDTVNLSASSGHYVCSIPNLTTTAVVERAEFALSMAKDRPGGEGDASTGIAEERENWFALERALRASDIGREFSVRFQPQVDLSSGEATGFEALARWNSPTLGETPPSVFIRIAETSGFISKLSPALLEKALAHAKAWPEALPVSFNLSALDLVSTTTIDRICEVVERSGVAPGRIEFEITETALMHDFRLARGNLRRFAECGHPVALDDFGVGYSNFSYLKQLPITKLKVDKSFLDGLGEDPAALKLVRAMIELAESLGMACVFEGVETQEEAQSLASVGGSIIQGYLVGEPMDPEAVAGFLQDFGQGDARHVKILGPGSA